jgi:hypothetical protein
MRAATLPKALGWMRTEVKQRARLRGSRRGDPRRSHAGQSHQSRRSTARGQGRALPNLKPSRCALEGAWRARKLMSLIDPSVVRGLEYYTGPVYEAELLREVTGDEDGKTYRIGSIGGGGRYDDLVARFTGREAFRPRASPSGSQSPCVPPLQIMGETDEARRPGRRAQPRPGQSVHRRSRNCDGTSCKALVIRAEAYMGSLRQYAAADEICRPPQRTRLRSWLARMSSPKAR